MGDFDSDFDSRDPLPETPKDQQFLLEIPDNLDLACLQVQKTIEKRAITGELKIIEVVIAIREALALPIDPHDRGATIVIINAIREAVKFCGYTNPEVIFRRLKERKEKLQATPKTN